MSTPHLFQPITLRGLTVPGRAWVSPMCQYSCRASEPGFVTDWHLAHLASFAIGGAPLILTEATAVVREGRISPQDAGLWEDQQATAWKRVVDLVHRTGSLIGIQLGHAGRKGSTYPPFDPRSGSVPIGGDGWQTVGPTDAPFPGLAAPVAMSTQRIRQVVDAFAAAARRAVSTGFDLVEIHGAHGYLLAEFLSPLANDRTDEYGGSDQGRARFLLEVVAAVRAAVPDRFPVQVRLSATEWSDEPGAVEEDLQRTVQVAGWLREAGVDLIDVSSGGNLASASIPVGPGYQTGFAARVRERAQVPVGAVGMITGSRQAEHVLASGQADAVLLGRAALADPRWWHRAAHELGHELAWPGPYARVRDEYVY